jgi:hypothetical protein
MGIGGRGGVRMRMVDVGIVLFTIRLSERDMGRGGRVTSMAHQGGIRAV